MPRRARSCMVSAVMSSPLTVMLPLVSRDDSDDHVKAGGFTCTVWSQQAHDLATVNCQ